MRLTSRKMTRDKSIELSMTSMIDVVFLLLIFFMTAASLIKTERDMETATKVKQKDAKQSQSDLEPAVVEIVNSGSGYVYKIGNRETNQISELRKILLQFENKGDGAFIRVTDDVPFGMAAAAVHAAKTARFVPVSYVPMASK